MSLGFFIDIIKFICYNNFMEYIKVKDIVNSIFNTYYSINETWNRPSFNCMKQIADVLILSLEGDLRCLTNSDKTRTGTADYSAVPVSCLMQTGHRSGAFFIYPCASRQRRSSAARASRFSTDTVSTVTRG